MKKLGTIFAASARTPFGPDLLSTALMMRTGMAAFTSAPLAAGDTAESVTMGFDPTLDPFLVGEERAGALAALALRDLATEATRSAEEALTASQVKVVVATASPRPDQPRADVGVVLNRELRSAVGATFGSASLEVEARGSAGLAYLLPQALEALAARRVDAVIAGGVHSDYDPATIRSLAEEGRLFQPDVLDSIVPGECAAFILIGRSDLGRRLGLRPLAHLVGLATEESSITAYSTNSAFDASALADVFRGATAGLPEELKVGWALGDHAFEHFRTRELYAAITRTSGLFGEPFQLDAPAQRLGRTGAASLPLFLAMASESYRRGYAAAPIGMVFAASDDGERGAIVVSSP